MRSCLLFVLSFGCVALAQGPADLVIHNGKIVTIDEEQARAEAVAIAGERILFVGSNADVLAYIDAARTTIIDAGGRLITPGFNDAHIHFVEGGRGMLDVDLRDADTLGEVQEKVKARAAELPAGTLIRGRGWDHERFADKAWPTKETLDAVTPDHPVALSRVDGHSIWVNSFLLLNANARIAFGTDWPVEPVDPLEGLYAAVTRKDRAGEAGEGWFADQRLTMEEAIELYTLGAAYAEFTENRKGRIRAGYLADLVIFDRDLLTIPADEIMDAQVDTTLVGGRIVYQRQ